MGTVSDWRRNLFLALIAIALAGCAGLGPRYQVAISGLAPPGTGKGSFIVLPGNKGETVTDLQYQEFERILTKALVGQGFGKAAGLDQVEHFVILKYGIGDPRSSSYSYSLPVWGQTGVSSSYTTGTATYTGYGTASYSGTTTYTPQYGVTGYSQHLATRTTFDRYVSVLALDAAAYRKDESIVESWQTMIASSGSSGDLREVFPIMIAAAAPHFGVNTGKAKTVTLTSGSPKVKALKSGP